MRKIHLLILILIFLAASLTLSLAATGKYRWGYRPLDLVNYPSDFMPDNDPRSVIVDYKALFRVNKNPAREDVRLYLPLPASNPLYQQVLSYRLDPEPTRILRSKYGYQIAEFNFGPLSKDIAFGVRYHAEIDLFRVHVPLVPELVGGLDEVPENIRRDYTRNGPYYRINDPFIQQAAKEAVGDETNVLRQVKRIWLYVRERLYYLGDGRKDTAARVLKQGHGSCTEYSFSMIALCRANGIPARYISGSIHKTGSGQRKSRDTIYHKIVEVYLPRVGWVPMESTAGDRYVTPQVADEQIGKLAGRMVFFQTEPEKGLAPLDPRRNTVTWINRTMRSQVSLAGEVSTQFEGVRNRAE